MSRVGFGKGAIIGDRVVAMFDRFGPEYGGVKIFVNCTYIFTVV